MSHSSFLRVLLFTLVCWPGLAVATGNALPGQLPPEPALAWQSGHVVHVVWERDPQVPGQRFNVYLADGSGWSLLTPTPLDQTVFLDDAGTAAGTRTYRIVALDGSGTETSQTATIAIDIADHDLSSALEERHAIELDAAAAFDKNTIITDAQLTDFNAMTVSSIQSFLASYNGPLSRFSSGGSSAAQIIYDACQTYGISPYLVLTTLEKERSLIRSSSANPDYCAMGWDSCHDPTVIKFVDQIHYGTRQFRLYLNNISNYKDVRFNPWALNVVRYVTDGTVSVTTTATAGLYAYTPVIGVPPPGGNYLFWNLWYNVFHFTSGGSTSTDPLVTALANTAQTVAWCYIMEPTSGWYIVSPAGEQVLYLDRVDKNTSFGIYWRPVNNASFQGYQPAGRNFASVVVAPDGGTVQIGSALGPLSPVGEALSNTTHQVLWGYIFNPSTGWYIVSPSGQQVMFLDRVDQNVAGGILWKPINNSSFSGYAPAGQNYSSVVWSADGRSISFGSLSAHATVGLQASAETHSIGSEQTRVRATDLPPGVTLHLTVNPSGNGHVDVNPNQVGYAAGTIVQLTPVPDSGWVFGTWSGDANGNQSPLQLTMDADKTINATFVIAPPACYSLTANASPSAGGTASVSTPQNCAGGYAGGTSAAIVASPNSGYRFSNWIASNCTLANANASSTTCTLTGGGNASVMATFTTVAPACYPLTANASPSTGGTVSVSTPQNCAGGYTGGTAAGILASPNSGYRFSNWIASNCTLANANASSTTCTVTGGGNAAVTATFTPVAPACYPLTANASPSAGGTASVSTPQNCAGGFTGGTSAAIVSSPNSGYQFSDWIASNCTLANANASSTTCTVTGGGNATVTATFTLVAPACYSFTANASPSGGGTVSVSTPQSCAGGYTGGTAAAIAASPNTGYQFSNWIASNCTLANASASSTTCTVTGGGNATVTAAFTPVAPPVCYSLTANASPSGGGIANISTPQNCAGGYAGGTDVAIFASPNSGYQFSNWIATNCGLANTNASSTTCTLTGGDNASVTAIFRAEGSPRRHAAGPPPTSTLIANISAPSNTTPNTWTQISIGIGGTATGPLTFRVWPNCSYTGTDSNIAVAQCGGGFVATAPGTCAGSDNGGWWCSGVTTSWSDHWMVQYASSGTFTPKIIVERSGLSVEARTSIYATGATIASTFSQQGPKLVATDAAGIALQGLSLSLSSDGNTAVVGGWGDNNATGAAWVLDEERRCMVRAGQTNGFGSARRCRAGHFCVLVGRRRDRHRRRDSRQWWCGRGVDLDQGQRRGVDATGQTGGLGRVGEFSTGRVRGTLG